MKKKKFAPKVQNWRIIARKTVRSVCFYEQAVLSHAFHCLLSYLSVVKKISRWKWPRVHAIESTGCQAGSVHCLVYFHNKLYMRHRLNNITLVTIEIPIMGNRIHFFPKGCVLIYSRTRISWANSGSYWNISYEIKIWYLFGWIPNNFHKLVL